MVGFSTGAWLPQLVEIVRGRTHTVNANFYTGCPHLSNMKHIVRQRLIMHDGSGLHLVELARYLGILFGGGMLIQQCGPHGGVSDPGHELLGGGPGLRGQGCGGMP